MNRAAVLLVVSVVGCAASERRYWVERDALAQLSTLRDSDRQRATLDARREDGTRVELRAAAVRQEPLAGNTDPVAVRTRGIHPLVSVGAALTIQGIALAVLGIVASVGAAQPNCSLCSTIYTVPAIFGIAAGGTSVLLGLILGYAGVGLHADEVAPDDKALTHPRSRPVLLPR